MKTQPQGSVRARSTALVLLPMPLRTDLKGLAIFLLWGLIAVVVYVTGDDTARGGVQFGAAFAGIALILALLSDDPLYGHRILNVSTGMIAFCGSLGWLSDGAYWKFVPERPSGGD